jgi:hypothetical protein
MGLVRSRSFVGLELVSFYDLHVKKVQFDDLHSNQELIVLARATLFSNKHLYKSSSNLVNLHHTPFSSRTNPCQVANLVLIEIVLFFPFFINIKFNKSYFLASDSNLAHSFKKGSVNFK